MLKFAAKSTQVPLGLLATVHHLKRFAKLDYTFEGDTDVVLTLPGGQSVTGNHNVMRTLLRLHNPSIPTDTGLASLYDPKTNPVEASLVDYWLDFAQTRLVGSDHKGLASALVSLDTHLRFRTVLVGYQVTLADYAVWGALKSHAVFGRNLKTGKGDVGVSVARWVGFVGAQEAAKEAVAAVEGTKNAANKAKKDQGSFEIDLPGAKSGAVVTRFPPEPSGYLHIGHAKAALLNEYFARTYHGKLLVRFDDTNPSKEKTEFEDSILEDLTLLGIKPDSVSHTSDYFGVLMEKAIELIKSGKAYVDDTPLEVMRDERMKGIESKCRNLSVEENLKRFESMKQGTPEGQKSALRAKIDMSSPNGTLRDPVMYRYNADHHHRTGNKYKIYPTYDFACPVVDSLEGVTHALRTNEYRDRNPQFDWVIDALGLRKVHIWDYSRVSFEHTLLSKRKLTKLVEMGRVTGWDDPRFPTVRGIRRRGMTIEALRTYILMQGASQKELMLSWDKIWAVNKKVVDPVAPRHTAIVRDNIVKVKVVDDGKEVKLSTQDLPKHKKNPDVGTKTTVFSGELYLEFADAKELKVGEEITLMDWGNAIVSKITWNGDHTAITGLDLKLHLAGDFKTTEKKVTWLSRKGPQAEQEPVRAILFDYDYLITKKKIEQDDEMEDFLTPVTEFKTEAWCDGNVRGLKRGDIIQLERKGYYICDKAWAGNNSEVHLIYIPDGKLASVQSRAATVATASLPVIAGSAGSSAAVEGERAAEQATASKMYVVKSFVDFGKVELGDSKMYNVKSYV
ncbi:tRNA synthetases class I, catalytic domain-containing protein [Cladochytrium replicatum]|nr:tRNA synthetases class I, catalytic domain-containing protein [Cladochytrium replicatum]